MGRVEKSGQQRYDDNGHQQSGALKYMPERHPKARDQNRKACQQRCEKENAAVVNEGVKQNSADQASSEISESVPG
jgi:hypothetical protein